MRRFCAVLLLLLPAGGCAGAAGADSNQVSCDVTLSGAATDAFACDGTTATWNAASNQGTFEMSANDTGPPSPFVHAKMEFVGEPQPTTYVLNGKRPLVSVQVDSGSGIWFVGAIGETADSAFIMQGSYALTLTSVSVTSTVTTGKVYLLHGTLDAALPPHPTSGGTAAGTVALHVVF